MYVKAKKNSQGTSILSTC